jgi:hypothetical protein
MPRRRRKRRAPPRPTIRRVVRAFLRAPLYLLAWIANEPWIAVPLGVLLLQRLAHWTLPLLTP